MERVPDAERWDADFQLWLSSTISRRLQTDPPPPGARLADDARRSAANLARDARARLADLGVQSLRVAR